MRKIEIKVKDNNAILLCLENEVIEKYKFTPEAIKLTIDTNSKGRIYYFIDSESKRIYKCNVVKAKENRRLPQINKSSHPWFIEGTSYYMENIRYFNRANTVIFPKKHRIYENITINKR